MILPNLIGLTGKKRSGKSTVADALTGHTRLSFATPIKRAVFAMGLTQAEAEEKEKVVERFGASPRKLWQTLGTEWGRDLIHRDLWLRLARDEAESILRRGYRVVFDDVRFDNEAQMIRDLGGVVWEICRPSRLQSLTDAHPSEVGVDPQFIDRVCYNAGNKTELCAWALSAAMDLKEVPA